jgi:hypothetical protein
MSDPRSAWPDLCSIRTTDGQEELAEAVCGFSADGRRPAGDDPPAPPASGIDRAIRLSTAAAVLTVAGISAYVSYWHAYAVVRAHGETGITAQLEPVTIDGLVYASSMVALYAARHRVPVPSLARWLLALGIAATLTANMAQDWSHGPVGAAVAAWPTASLVGSYELSGLAHPHVRDGRTQAAGRAPLPWCGMPCCGVSPPGLSRSRRAPRSERARHVRPGVAARGSGRWAAVHPGRRAA